MSPDPKNYSSINASRKHHHHHKSSHSKRGFTRPNRLETLRLAIFAFLLATSFIALALSAHFLTVLQANDLTHFIPFALFTSVASIAGMIALVGVVLVHRSKPAALKVELGIMAVTGIFWLALSIFISTSPAESADVQCFSDDGDLIEIVVNGIDVPFDTQVFRAQYRVLTAVGSINAFILLILCAVLTFMALRHFNRTRDWVSTTRKPLLGEKIRSHPKSRDKSRSGRPAPPLTDLPKRVARRAVAAVGVGLTHNLNANAMKEKSRGGLPLPATAKGKSQSKDVNRNASNNAAGTRPPALPPAPAPISKPPPASKSKSTPAPPPKAKQSSQPKPPPPAAAATTSRTRPPVVKSKSMPATTPTSKNPPIVPPPKAKVATNTSGTAAKGKAAPVARRKTNG